MRRPLVLVVLAVSAVSGCTLVGYPAGVPAAVSAPVPVADRGDSARDPAGEPGATRRPARTDAGGDDAASRTGTVSGATRDLTDAEVAAIPDAIPVEEPRSPYGNPSEYEVGGRTYRVMESAEGYEAEGIASWYGSEFQGRRTSSGEPYDMFRMTAAHPTLPIPTYIEVTNLENGRAVVVRVNDRGPFHDNRIVDLSYVAARKLGIVGPGTARVRIRALEPGG